MLPNPREEAAALQAAADPAAAPLALAGTPLPALEEQVVHLLGPVRFSPPGLIIEGSFQCPLDAQAAAARLSANGAAAGAASAAGGEQSENMQCMVSSL